MANPSPLSRAPAARTAPSTWSKRALIAWGLTIGPAIAALISVVLSELTSRQVLFIDLYLYVLVFSIPAVPVGICIAGSEAVRLTRLPEESRPRGRRVAVAAALLGCLYLTLLVWMMSHGSPE